MKFFSQRKVCSIPDILIIIHLNWGFIRTLEYKRVHHLIIIKDVEKL